MYNCILWSNNAYWMYYCDKEIISLNTQKR